MFVCECKNCKTNWTINLYLPHGVPTYIIHSVSAKEQKPWNYITDDTNGKIINIYLRTPCVLFFIGKSNKHGFFCLIKKIIARQSQAEVVELSVKTFYGFASLGLNKRHKKCLNYEGTFRVIDSRFGLIGASSVHCKLALNLWCHHSKDACLNWSEDTNQIM